LSDSLLLDLGTQFDRFMTDGLYSLRVWPTCGEVSIVPVPVQRSGEIAFVRHVATSGSKVDNDNPARSLRRAKSAVRRYNVHNGLDQMITFTFRGDVPGVDDLSAVMHNFFRRLDRAFAAVGIDPDCDAYLWVPEWGSRRGRLHLHMCVRWWDWNMMTEVCRRCATPNLLRKRADVPRVGELLCIGCVWGHGFVGAPEDNTNGRALSNYLYVSKGLGSGLHNYRQSYRVGKGSQPQSVVEVVETPDEAVSLILSQLDAKFFCEGQTPIMYVPSFDGPLAGLKVGLLNFND